MAGTSQDTFDFIIVGGGTAGSVLASRLSHALPQLSFLLIEAGPASHPSIEHPLGHTGPGTGVEWPYVTVPQSHAGGKVVNCMYGKVLGGSTAINYQAWTRGPSVDFDQWAELVGDERWSWKGLLPYFKKSETFYRGESEVDMSLHGTDGPIRITHVTSTQPFRKYPLRKAIAAAYDSVGVQRNSDMNSGDPTGYSELCNSVYAGKRQWAAEYYKPASNVRVMVDALAERIVFDEKRASGVQISINGGSRVMKAKKEVIICSGALGSPKLLLQSGVGPKQELDKHNIPQVVNLPVGENLSDHATVSTCWKLQDRKMSLGDVEMVTPDCDWTAGSPCDFFGFHRNEESILDLAKKTLKSDEAQRYIADGKVHSESFIMYGNFALGSPEIAIPTESSILTILNVVVNPTSRGTLRLSSSDPKSAPLVDTNLLASDLDRATLRSTVELSNLAMEKSPLQATEFGISSRVLNKELNEVEAFNERVDRTLFTIFHPSGTCAMGTVVDSECRVLGGVSGLRVIDASIFPQPIAAHYQAGVYAVSEMMADVIIGMVNGK